jgi:hypothetical protein
MREEIEHAAMLIEWIRRSDADFAGCLNTYLFTEGSLLKEGGPPRPPPTAMPRPAQMIPNRVLQSVHCGEDERWIT